MATTKDKKPEDGTVTVTKNEAGTHYDAFVSINGTPIRFTTFPVENVDAQVADANRERQDAASNG